MMDITAVIAATEHSSGMYYARNDYLKALKEAWDREQDKNHSLTPALASPPRFRLPEMHLRPFALINPNEGDLRFGSGNIKHRVAVSGKRDIRNCLR